MTQPDRNPLVFIGACAHTTPETPIPAPQPSFGRKPESSRLRGETDELDPLSSTSGAVAEIPMPVRVRFV